MRTHTIISRSLILPVPCVLQGSILRANHAYFLSDEIKTSQREANPGLHIGKNKL